MKILDEVVFTMSTRLHYFESNSLGMLHKKMSYHHGLYNESKDVVTKARIS